MSSGKEFIELLKNQREDELKIANAMETTAQSTTNPVVKYLINALVLDSKKHAGILQAIIDLRFGWQALSDAEKKEMMKALERHVEAEKQMLADTDNLIKKIDDSLVKSGLQIIAEDEKKHHKILGALIETLSTKTNQVDRWQWMLKEYSFGC